MPSMVEYIPGVAMVEYILGVANLNTNIQSKISKKITWFNLNLVYRGSLFLNAGISRCSCAVSGKTSRYWPGINGNLLDDYLFCLKNIKFLFGFLFGNKLFTNHKTL